MAKIEFLVIVAFAALASCTEVEDADQKKRGAGKGNVLNSIPTGGQKQDYTYSIYSQGSQSGSNPNSYQSQVSNSFYPNQANQYYAPNAPTDPSSGYIQQPQINLLPPTQSQFVPINFVPTPGYQSKYQIVPSQSKGNIQLAILQQPNNYQTPLYPSFPQNFFSPPTQSSSIAPHQNILNSLSSGGQFNLGPNLPLSLGGSYLGQPSAMVLLAQPNPSLYNNLLYNNPGQHLYNYFPSNAQPKYGLSYGQQSSDLQVPSVAKEENEINSHTSDYTALSDTSSSYKPSYVTTRSSYSSKL